MTAEVGRISFSPIATTVITRSLDVFNNIHEASYVGNYQCVFTVSSNPCEENLACPHRAGVLETAAAFKADFMRRRFKIPIPGSWPILRSLLSRTNPSRLPRTEKRLDRSSDSGHGYGFSLSMTEHRSLPISPSPLIPLCSLSPSDSSVIDAKFPAHDDTCLVRKGLREDGSCVKSLLLQISIEYVLVVLQNSGRIVGKWSLG